MLDHAKTDLPNDVDALRDLVVSLRATVRHHQALIDKLKLQLARLRRMHPLRAE